MATALNHDGSITVTAYGLPEFTFEIAYLGSKGFTPSMLNSHCPTGGMGSTYQAILVPLTSHYISLDGTHMNLPEQEAQTSKETSLKDDSSDVNGVGGTDVSETANTVKTAVKRTTKKTT
ncbi:MAG: hypothetical protein WBP57_08405 [Ignavibacteria bacterium]